MAAVERSVEVEVPLEHFWRVVNDFESYKDFLTELRGVEVARRSPGESEVTYLVEIDAGIARKTLRYTLQHTEQPPNLVRWELLRGDIMKTNSGTWTLDAIGPKRTRATYSIDIRFGLLVPKSVSNFLAERNLPRMLGEFKARAEGLWRE